MRAVVTGASGWLAETFAEAARRELPDVGLVGVSRGPVDPGLWDARVPNADFAGGFRLEPGDVVVHCAFCRRSEGGGLVESLEWSRTVFGKAALAGAAGIVNVSSQSVYGGDPSSRVEDAAMAPGYPYALAKAASEVLLEATAASCDYGAVGPASAWPRSSA